jgi:hypothetical protein
MRIFRFIVLFSIFTFLSGCSTSGTTPASAATPATPATPETKYPVGPSGKYSPPAGSHESAAQSVLFDPNAGTIELLPERTGSTHLDLSYLWKYYPQMLSIKPVSNDPVKHILKVSIKFTNPMAASLCDVRAIWPSDGDFVPVTIDGWTVRDGAPIFKPDPYFGFGNDLPKRMLKQKQESTREITFSYKDPLILKTVTFVLDATVGINTAEPYAFGNAQLTGRLFHIQISDWQNDIGNVYLDTTPAGMQARLKLAPFGDNGEWGTSVPDILPGKYQLILTAESPESPGEDKAGLPVTAVQKVDLKWPPEGLLVPLPKGQGIYGYTNLIDPDTNLAPTNPAAFMAKFKNDMGGKFIILEYGAICNSGYLAMHDWLPLYIQWMHSAAPNLPIHVNLAKVGFKSIQDDPCQHAPENYTQLFFDHLLDSIRGQILENPEFDSISGLHFDIEPFPGSYSPEELRAIYNRYADFLARLHMEPKLRGMNITHWDFDSPLKRPDILTYLCTSDAFMPGCYYSEFSYQWDPKQYPTPFYHLKDMLATYNNWSQLYGRPFYPSMENFGGWVDGNLDTLSKITICPDKAEWVIDEYCFGKGPLHTSNEFEVVKAHDITGMWPEKVVLNLPTGEPIFPSSGLAVYRMGDGIPSTLSDDFVYCRTAYAMAESYEIVNSMGGMLMPGTATFRYETNHSWVAAALGHPVPRGSITGCSGRVRFNDGLDIQLHPELWGKITIELVDPHTPEIIDNPVYRKSIDIVGVEDGSYIFPDLPRAIVKIRAVSAVQFGWTSPEVEVDLRGPFAYKENVDLMLSQ